MIWRAAWAVGGCSPEDAVLLDGLLPRISGRSAWPGPLIDTVGLVRGDLPQIQNALAWAAAVAPTLQLELYCAETWGQRDCEVMFSVVDGAVARHRPKRLALRPKTQDEELDWLLESAEILQ